MRCPYCTKTDISVLESRDAEEGACTRRRRKCNCCAKRFTTYERIEGVDLKVMKKDGRLQDFDREKIKRGLIKATWKRPVHLADLDTLIDEVEAKLRRRKNTTVRSFEIGKMVIHRLKRLDPLGYLLFASVYRDFEGLGDFKREIDALMEHHSVNSGSVS